MLAAIKFLPQRIHCLGPLAATTGQDRDRRLALSTATTIAAKGIALLGPLVTLPLTIRYLGVERFGMWSTLSSSLALLSFADFGLGSGLLSEIAYDSGRSDLRSLHRTLSTATTLLVSFAFVVLTLFVLLSRLLSWRNVFGFSTTISDTELTSTLFVLVGATAANLPLSVTQRLQNGLQLGYVANIWSALGNLLSLGALILVSRLAGGIHYLAAALVGVPTLILTASWIIQFTQTTPELRPRLTFRHRSVMLRLAKSGILFFSLQITSIMAFASDSLVANHYLGPGAVARLNLDLKVFCFGNAILAAIAGALWPAYREAFARKDFAWIRRTLVLSLVGTFTSISIYCGVLTLARHALYSLYATEELTPNLTLSLILSLYAILLAMGNTAAMFLNGCNIVKPQVLMALVMGGFALIIKAKLATLFGLDGLLGGTIIAYSFITVPTTVILIRNALTTLK